MKARILFLAGSLVLAACDEPEVSSDEPQIATPSPSPRVLYLSRRVAIATEESLYGLEAGTELKFIEARPAGFLVEAQGMQFEIDQRDATTDRELAERLLARAEKRKAIQQVSVAAQWQLEDQKFLAEENIRRSAGEQIARLRHAIGSAKAEITRLEARPTRTDRGAPTAATPPDDRQRISILEAYIADCDRKIQMLSEAMPAAE